MRKAEVLFTWPALNISFAIAAGGIRPALSSGGVSLPLKCPVAQTLAAA